MKKKKKRVEFAPHPLPGESPRHHINRLRNIQRAYHLKNGWVGHQFHDIWGVWPHLAEELDWDVENARRIQELLDDSLKD